MKKEINSTEDKGNNSAHMQTYFRFQDLFLRHSQVTSQVREYNPSSNYKLVLKNVVHTLNFEGIWYVIDMMGNAWLRENHVQWPSNFQ